MQLFRIISTLFFIVMLSTGGMTIASTTDDVKSSGKIVNGLRELSNNDLDSGELTVYRGDYVVFPVANDSSNILNIKTLNINKNFPAPVGKKNYVKFKQAGVFEYSYGPSKGKVTVIEYQHAQYKAVRANEAKQIIDNIDPYILDVRTKMEYEKGHLANSTLIPVQSIQRKYQQLLKYKEKPILIYCASGNRSTVTARFLIKNGFKKIYNMRYGIKDWQRSGLKILR